MADVRRLGAPRGTRFRGALLFALAAAAVPAPDAGAAPRIANVSQGTNMALALSPDGETLVVDLLGRLWRLPSSGGAAERLTPDDEAARHPRIGPAGDRVVYQRLVDGQWDLWLLDLPTGERRPLVQTANDEREPDFTPDGRSVVFAGDATGHFCLWKVEIATGVLTQLTEEPGDASFPTVSEHGEIAYVRQNGESWSLRVLLPTGAGADLLASKNRLSSPSWRPGGGVLLFNEQTAGERGAPRSSEMRMLLLSPDPVVKTLTRTEDVFESRPAWASPADYYYTADGRVWRRGVAWATREPVHLFAAVSVDSTEPTPLDVELDAPGAHPVLGVTGRSRSADGRVEVFTALGDLWLGARDAPRRLTDDPFVDVDASVSPDGDFAVFASDRGGFMDLWQVTLPGGVLTQLTRSPAKDYRPVVSPDGRRVAFLETDGLETFGAARLAVVELGGATPSARTIAVLDAPSELRWEDGERVSVAVAGRAGEQAASARRLVEVDIASGRSRPLPPRDPDGRERAAPRAADEIELAEAAAPLEWQPIAPSEPYVVQAGRLLDGIRSDYLRHVDVHIEGQRIKAIVARGVLPLPERVVDARDATVIPGLIDAHAHHSSLTGERLGRAWLAAGVTTVRELTDDVAAAVERAESWASGRRLGPRLIVSPAAGAPAPAGTDAPPSPIPVRTYSGLETAASLFLPRRLPSYGWTLAEHGAERGGYVLRTSPLRIAYEDVFNTIVQSRTVVTSGLGAAGGVPAKARSLIEHPVFARLFSPEERALWLDAAGSSSALPALAENIVRLVRAGGLVAAGTDAPAIPYGLGVHLELALLADAGIPADQVLRIASASNALALGLERQLGTLEPGKLADFVVVDGNPLVEVADALNVVAVVRGGTWLEEARLSTAP